MSELDNLRQEAEALKNAVRVSSPSHPLLPPSKQLCRCPLSRRVRVTCRRSRRMVDSLFACVYEDFVSDILSYFIPNR